jgi:hypothetical protein
VSCFSDRCFGGRLFCDWCGGFCNRGGNFRSRRFDCGDLSNGGGCRTGELALLDALVDDDGEIAAGGVDDRGQALRGRLNEEEELREELFLARQGGEGLDLLDGDDLAVDDAQLEGELGVVLDPVGEGLGECDRIARGVGD